MQLENARNRVLVNSERRVGRVGADRGRDEVEVVAKVAVDRRQWILTYGQYLVLVGDIVDTEESAVGIGGVAVYPVRQRPGHGELT